MTEKVPPDGKSAFTQKQTGRSNDAFYVGVKGALTIELFATDFPNRTFSTVLGRAVDLAALFGGLCLAAGVGRSGLCSAAFLRSVTSNGPFTALYLHLCRRRARVLASRMEFFAALHQTFSFQSIGQVF